MPEGIDEAATAALAATRAVLARLDVLRGIDTQPARVAQLSEIAAELGAVHAFADILEFGRRQADATDDGALAPRRTDEVPATALAAARHAAMDAIRVAAGADSPEIQRLRAALQAVSDQAAIDDDAALRRRSPTPPRSCTRGWPAATPPPNA